MNSMETLTTFLGWCTVINMGFILFLFLFVSLFCKGIGKLSAKFFGVTKEEAKATLFRVFLQYRLTWVLLNLVPYLALKIMA